MKNPLDWARAAEAATFHSKDEKHLAEAVQGVNSVLEFGPGNTTDLFIKAGVPRIITCEYIKKWYEVARERFAENMNVGVLLFTDTIPVVVEGLDPDEMFDFGFVDSPKGYAAARYAHPGYEDCSRFNTTLFALERCKVVYLHDAIRALERGTLGRLNAMGYDHTFLDSPIGLARITKRNGEDADGSNQQDVA
jgi:hypothetical protein